MDGPSGPSAIVRFEGVTRRFGDTVALSDVDLDIEPGRIVGVIGPSGAGKTTAVRLMTGELLPTEGTVRVLGEDPADLSGRARQSIGFMPQQFALYDDLTAGENVDFVASMFGLLFRGRRRRTRRVLELLGLWEVRRRRAGDLSGGMQRRLQLASALVHDPSLIFLDEPTAGIDPLLRETIWTELDRLRDDGRTLVVTTQYVTEAERCDVVALIADGRLLAYAPPDALRDLAFGGQVLEVTTERPFDGADIEVARADRPRATDGTPLAAGHDEGCRDDHPGRHGRGRTRRRLGGVHHRAPVLVRRGLRGADPQGRRRAGRSDRMRGLLAALLRILAVLGKELLETFRRPWAVATIVLGPFVILVVFGLGYLGQPAIRAALVIPDGSGLPTDLATYQDACRRVGRRSSPSTPTEEAARDRLRARDVDLIVIAPDDGQATLERGRAGRPARRIRQHRPVHRPPGRQRGRPDLERRQSGAHPPGGRARRRRRRAPRLRRCHRGTTPDLVAAPTRAEVQDLAPTAPSVTWFYGIAVLALIVQHMTVTLGALSIFRDGRRGLVELFRLSPIRSGELLHRQVPRDRAGERRRVRGADHAARGGVPAPGPGRPRRGDPGRSRC